MPCFNPGPYLKDAVASVLAQPECLELIIVDGGSTDGSKTLLIALELRNPQRIKLIIEPDHGPADALNKALKLVRGTLIGWLNADDLYPDGALARAVAALERNPDWLMMYGEGEEYNAYNSQRMRYPTLQPYAGLERFRSHCYICQPTVVFRRSLAVLLGPFDLHWRTAFDFDYWLRAFRAFPKRIGYVPTLQGITRIHQNSITSKQRAQVALEATELLARHFNDATTSRLEGYALELQMGIAKLPPGISMEDHLAELCSQAAAWVNSEHMAQFRQNWLLDAETAKAQLNAEIAAERCNLKQRPSIQLFQLLQPHLRFDHPGPPAGPHSRLKAATTSFEKTYPLLLKDEKLRELTTSIQKGARTLLHPFGVNLIISPRCSGELVLLIQRISHRLKAAGVPVSLQRPTSEGGKFAINLVCLSPTEHGRWLLEAGLGPQIGRITLAAWPWIGDRWHEAWKPLLSLVDGVYSHNATQHSAIKTTLTNPIYLMGPDEIRSWQAPAKEIISNTPVRNQMIRSQHKLPNDGVLIAMSADLELPASLINSFGAIATFQRAFPPEEQREAKAARPHLIVLVNSSGLANKNADSEWQWLQASCQEDPHLHLCTINDLLLNEYYQLIACCNVWLSLRRGHAVATELITALQLGLQLVVTSDNMTSEIPSTSSVHLVPSWRVPIPRGIFPEGEGMDWAEPDHRIASDILQKVIMDLTTNNETEQGIGKR